MPAGDRTAQHSLRWADPESAGPSPAPLPRRELFTDERGTGMRASWHPEREVVVLSLWKGDRCAATFHLPLADADRLAEFLMAHQAQARGTRDAAADATVALRVVADNRG